MSEPITAKCPPRFNSAAMRGPLHHAFGEGPLTQITGQVLAAR